ncbi:MAG: HhH-GDP family DNA glycosylase [Planctomycetota bacterium]
MPTLGVPAAFRLRSTVRSHGWSTIGPFDSDRAGDTLQIALPDGRATVRQRGRRLDIRGSADTAAVRACLQPELDLAEFWALAENDPDLAWAARQGAGRMLRAPTAFADAVMVLATTNCSWALTTRMLERLVARWGENGAFPTQERLRRVRESSFRAASWGYRAPYLAALAKGPCLESLRSDPRPTPELRRELLGLPGFGAYAADSMLKLLGRFEHLALDSWVTRVWKEIHPRRKATEPAIRRALRGYGRWTGLAFFLTITRHWYERPYWKAEEF